MPCTEAGLLGGGNPAERARGEAASSSRVALLQVDRDVPRVHPGRRDGRSAGWTSRFLAGFPPWWLLGGTQA
jgi:hypothetical protein